MKKILTIVILFISFQSFSQSMNGYARMIRDNYSDAYEHVFKKHAIEKWGEDYMQVGEMINKQTEAFVKVIKKLDENHAEILLNAIDEYTYEGFEIMNLRIWENDTMNSVQKMAHLHVDWEMVEKAYDEQVADALAL
jgi:hypothetical protein